MFNFFASIKVSRIFLLSLLFLTFIIFIVVTVFSTFIYNNSRLQLVESLYIQAQSINKLMPDYNQEINFDDYADRLAIQDSEFNELRVTIIDKNWNVIGDSLVNKEDLYLLEKQIDISYTSCFRRKIRHWHEIGLTHSNYRPIMLISAGYCKTYRKDVSYVKNGLPDIKPEYDEMIKWI